MGGDVSYEVKDRTFSALPEDQTPYPGPAWQFGTMTVFTKIKARSGFGKGSEAATSDLSEHYQTFQNQYAKYYQLATFLKIPFTQCSAGWTSEMVQYQGMFVFFFLLFSLCIYASTKLCLSICL